MIGQIIIADKKPYEIIKLLGKGKGGYSYLAKANDVFVVLKKIHYEPCDYFQFENNKLNSELRDYKTLFDIGIPIPKLLFFNQSEQYLIKEYIEGDTLAKVVAKNQMTQNYIIQLFSMCKKLYPHNLNIDYFPTNFIVRDGLLYYIDYECSNYSDEWNFENWGIYFLANSQGMADFLETNNYESLLVNGKPITNAFEAVVKQWILLKHHCT